MRLLITGGAGFIGSNYTRWLLANTADSAVVYDALTYAGSLANLDGVLHDARVDFVRGDVCDRVEIARAMDRCDAVVHFAAESHVDRSIADSDAFMRTNCVGTNVVCDEARRAGIGRVVHVSTDEVYGSIDSGSFTEECVLNPSSPYAASKAASDVIALAHHRTYGVDVVVTRSSNNFGPYQFPEKMIPLFVARLLAGQAVPVYGDGANVRDWCHVQDSCAGIDTVLRRGVAGEIYNMGGGNETTNLALARRLVELCGRDRSAIEMVEDRPGHDRRYSLDCAKAATLGWRPRRFFEEALAETVDWYRENRQWWSTRLAAETSRT